MHSINELLIQKCKTIFEVDSISGTDDLYEYNMDSLNTHQIIEFVNEKFRVYLQDDIIKRHSTIEQLSHLIASRQNDGNDKLSLAREQFKFLKNPSSKFQNDKKPDLIEKIQQEMLLWKAEWQIIKNELKNKNVLIWCFQNRNEYEGLQNALIEYDIYLIGLKSLAQIGPNSEENFNAIVNYYVKKIIEIEISGCSIGGNCQGGAIALGIKRKLDSAPVNNFIWLDSFYPELCSSHNDEIIFGEFSTFYNSEYRSHLLKGLAHGEYFKSKNVDKLADTIHSIVSINANAN